MYWSKYVKDLAQVDLPQAQQELARALVLLRIARISLCDAKGLQQCNCGESHDEEVAQALDRFDDSVQQSVALAPTHVRSYEVWADRYTWSEEPEQVAAVWRRALEAIPDHLDALLHLTRFHLQRDEPLEAGKYVFKAKQAKPLDREIAELVWMTHVRSARHYARQDQFDDGRREFERADSLFPERRQTYDQLARQAALEMKAGCSDQARVKVEQAQECLEEPTPLWLMLAIEAERFDLPKQERWLYEKRWTDSLKRRWRSSTAGHICRLLAAHMFWQHDYRPTAEVVGEVKQYVARCSRVKWKQPDLQAVCAFLLEIDEDVLASKYATKGRKVFPGAAYFHALAGELELRRGPFACDLDEAQSLLATAVDLAEKADDPADQLMLPETQRKLDWLEEFGDHPFEDFWEEFDYDVDDEEEGEDDELESGFPIEGLSLREVRRVIETMLKERV